MISLSIIIPTYNEAGNIKPLIEELFNQIDHEIADVEIIVVDDNSPDKTADIAQALTKLYPITVICRAGKMGLGSAVRAGLKVSTRPFVGVMDGDLSHDPAMLNKMILSLETNQIVIGSRFLSDSKICGEAKRKILSRLGVYFAHLLTSTSDPLSGYFFIHKSVIANIELRTNGYKILFEILVKGTYQSVAELPISFRQRKCGVSKLNIKECWLFMGQLLNFAIYKLFHPTIHKI